MSSRKIRVNHLINSKCENIAHTFRLKQPKNSTRTIKKISISFFSINNYRAFIRLAYSFKVFENERDGTAIDGMHEHNLQWRSV